jgi:hypothetical protein
VIDANYITISHAVSDYISMSSDEFSRCTTTPSQCYVTNPAVPITSNADCSMVTYRDLAMKCPLLETDIVPSPTLHIKDNKVIYSVPSETGLLARCDNTKTHNLTRLTSKSKAWERSPFAQPAPSHSQMDHTSNPFWICCREHPRSCSL